MARLSASSAIDSDSAVITASGVMPAPVAGAAAAARPATSTATRPPGRVVATNNGLSGAVAAVAEGAAGERETHARCEKGEPGPSEGGRVPYQEDQRPAARCLARRELVQHLVT